MRQAAQILQTLVNFLNLQAKFCASSQLSAERCKFSCTSVRELQISEPLRIWHQETQEWVFAI